MQTKLLALVMLSLAACGPALPPPLPHPVPFPPAGGALEPDVDHLLATLSLRDKIAQLVVPWIPGTYAAYDDDRSPLQLFSASPRILDHH